MSRTLIQEGLIALREVAQRREVPGAPSDTRNLRLTVGGINNDGLLSKKGLDHLRRPQDVYYDDPELKSDFPKGSSSDKLKQYKQRLSTFEPRGGIPSVYHRDGNFNEYRPDMYKDPKTARRHRDIMLKHGGLETSTGSILAMDKDDVYYAIKNAIKK